MKIFLQKVMLQIDQKFLWLKKLKILPWSYVINDFNRGEIVGTFYKKEFQMTNQKEFRIEKVIKKKGNNYLLNWRVMIIHLLVWLIKKT